MAESTLDSLKALDLSRDQHVPRRNRFFAVSVASSAASSRASSPAPLAREKYPYTRDGGPVDVPSRQIDMYDATLHWWRAAIRRSLVKFVQRESEVIAKMQVGRSSALDVLVLNSSILLSLINPAFLSND